MNSKRVTNRNKKIQKKSRFSRKNNKKGGVGPIKNIDKTTTSQIITTFLEMLNIVKLYHWNTRIFSQHKATDELYGELNKNIDKFVEILLGKQNDRINLLDPHLLVMDKKETVDFITKLNGFRDYLINMNEVLDGREHSDLLNIRDEILGNINQTLYLFSLD